MSRRKDPKQLFKLMTYVVGHQPDEFGLAPDQDGFFRIKDVIKAICEEPGWGYVRQSHVNEVLITLRNHPFVMQGDRIQVEHADEKVRPVSGVMPPKLLYHCVRRKAYPVVYQKGIMPTGHAHVFLATTEAMAVRMGKRRDPKPVLLTVLAHRAYQQGVQFLQQGQCLYLTDHIPVSCFSGPPLPKEKQEDQKGRKEQPVAPKPSPGSFALDMERSHELQRQRVKRKGLKKDVGWKKDARKLRRKQK
jgi:putative RNA 2'-phosphotransferase